MDGSDSEWESDSSSDDSSSSSESEAEGDQLPKGRARWLKRAPTEQEKAKDQEKKKPQLGALLVGVVDVCRGVEGIGPRDGWDPS